MKLKAVSNTMSKSPRCGFHGSGDHYVQLQAKFIKTKKRTSDERTICLVQRSCPSLQPSPSERPRQKRQKMDCEALCKRVLNMAAAAWWQLLDFLICWCLSFFGIWTSKIPFRPRLPLHRFAAFGSAALFSPSCWDVLLCIEFFGWFNAYLKFLWRGSVPLLLLR